VDFCDQKVRFNLHNLLLVVSYYHVNCSNFKQNKLINSMLPIQSFNDFQSLNWVNSPEISVAKYLITAKVAGNAKVFLGA
jgi:hypothetical protein